MIGRIRRFSWLLACLAAVGGCGGKPTGPTMLEASNYPYVSDLPLPAGFRLDERQSEHSRLANSRSVKHVYRGKDSPLAVKNFYQHYMPQLNWESVDDTLNRAVHLLKYHKGRERCDIRIEKMPSGIFGSVTQVRISIQPDATGTPG